MPVVGDIVSFEGAGQPLSLIQKELRDLAPGEVLVKNLYTTICGSDLHTYCGVRKEACPTVLGHEIVGEVISIGTGHSGLDATGAGLTPGDIVTWSVFASDPQSELSVRGIPQKGDGLFKYGHTRITGEDAFHGGLADYCFLRPGTAILKIPADMPLPIAATINCAIATAAGALRLAGDVHGRRVLITGAGMLGITCAAMCREAGAVSVCVADIDDARLQTAKQYGATALLNIKTPSDVPAEKDTDIAIDMSGAPDAIEYGLQRLAIGGIAVWVGTVFKTRPVQVDAESIIRGLLTIRGLHNYNYEDFRYALSFMAGNWNKYPFHQVVEKEYSLQEAEDAFKYAVAHKPLRVGIRIDQ